MDLNLAISYQDHFIISSKSSILPIIFLPQFKLRLWPIHVGSKMRRGHVHLDHHLRGHAQPPASYVGHRHGLHHLRGCPHASIWLVELSKRQQSRFTGPYHGTNGCQSPRPKPLHFGSFQSKTAVLFAYHIICTLIHSNHHS